MTHGTVRSLVERLPADATAEFAADWLRKTVSTYALDGDSIEVLLVAVLKWFEARALKRGTDTNPMLRGWGPLVAAAIEAERKRFVTTARLVFEAETARGHNPFYAFDQAMQAQE